MEQANQSNAAGLGIITAQCLTQWTDKHTLHIPVCPQSPHSCRCINFLQNRIDETLRGNWQDIGDIQTRCSQIGTWPLRRMPPWRRPSVMSVRHASWTANNCRDGHRSGHEVKPISTVLKLKIGSPGCEAGRKLKLKRRRNVDIAELMRMGVWHCRG